MFDRIVPLFYHWYNQYIHASILYHSYCSNHWLYPWAQYICWLQHICCCRPEVLGDSLRTLCGTCAAGGGQSSAFNGSRRGKRWRDGYHWLPILIQRMQEINRNQIANNGINCCQWIVDSLNRGWTDAWWWWTNSKQWFIDGEWTGWCSALVMDDIACTRSTYHQDRTSGDDSLSKFHDSMIHTANQVGILAASKTFWLTVNLVSNDQWWDHSDYQIGWPKVLVSNIGITIQFDNQNDHYDFWYPSLIIQQLSVGTLIWLVFRTSCDQWRKCWQLPMLAATDPP